MNAHNEREDRSKNTALDVLLETNDESYRTVSECLARLLARMKIPASLREDLVQEGWVYAVQHRDQFDQFEAGELKRRLLGLLRKVVHDKAVDMLRHLDCCACESLDAEEAEPIDDAESKHAKTTERREWLDALLETIRPGHEDNVLLFRLHFFDEYSIQELAQKFGRTAKSVDNRIRRVTNNLRQLVKGNH